MSAVLEQIDARFEAILGGVRGGGRARSDSMLPQPGREGILDVLYAQLHHVPNCPRDSCFGMKYLVLRHQLFSGQLIIAAKAASRRTALYALETNGVASYVVNLERDEDACVHPVAFTQTRSGPRLDFRGGQRSLAAMLADS